MYQPLKGKTQCGTCCAGGYCSNVADAGTYDGRFTACANGKVGKHDNAFCILCSSGTFLDYSLAARTL